MFWIQLLMRHLCHLRHLRWSHLWNCLRMRRLRNLRRHLGRQLRRHLRLKRWRGRLRGQFVLPRFRDLLLHLSIPKNQRTDAQQTLCKANKEPVQKVANLWQIHVHAINEDIDVIGNSHRTSHYQVAHSQFCSMLVWSRRTCKAQW